MSKTSKQQIIQHLSDLMATIQSAYFKGRMAGHPLCVCERDIATIGIDLYDFGGDGHDFVEGLHGVVPDHSAHGVEEKESGWVFCICYDPDDEKPLYFLFCPDDNFDDYSILPDTLPADLLERIDAWLEKAVQPQAPDKPNNDVSSFFYYMWNAWSVEECKTVFGNMWEHFWSKWMGAYERMNGPRGAAEVFYAELSKRNRGLLVKRATDVYDEDGYYKLDE